MFKIGDIIWYKRTISQELRAGIIKRIVGDKLYCNFDSFQEIPKSNEITSYGEDGTSSYVYKDFAHLIIPSNINRRIVR